MFINNFEIHNKKLIKYTGNEIEITIPKEVESIGTDAFFESSVKIINLGCYVKYLDEGCFRNTMLTRINFSDNHRIKVIPKECFQNSIYLDIITFSRTIKVIDERCFENCQSIKQLIFPRDLKEIRNYAFKDCINLREVVFFKNSNIKYIGDYVFENCNLLDKLLVPKNVSKISDNAFCSSHNLHVYLYDIKSLNRHKRAFYRFDNSRLYIGYQSKKNVQKKKEIRRFIFISILMYLVPVIFVLQPSQITLAFGALICVAEIAIHFRIFMSKEIDIPKPIFALSMMPFYIWIFIISKIFMGM